MHTAAAIAMQPHRDTGTPFCSLRGLATARAWCHWSSMRGHYEALAPLSNIRSFRCPTVNLQGGVRLTRVFLADAAAYIRVH